MRILWHIFAGIGLLASLFILFVAYLGWRDRPGCNRLKVDP